MTACPSCAGNNAPGAATCAYCGTALGGSKEVEIVWTATTGEGVRGKGRVSVRAPVAEAGERVRNLVEAAFSAAVDEVGAGASNEAIEKAMAARLEALLPDEHDVTALSLESYSGRGGGGGPPAPAAAARGRRRVAPTGPRRSTALLLLGVLLLLGGLGTFVCCGGLGGLSLLGSVGMAEDLAKLENVRIVPVAEVAAANGMIAVEAVVPTVDEPVLFAGKDGVEQPYLYVTETVSGITDPALTKSVSSFRLGELVVEPGAAKYDGEQQLQRETEGGKIRVRRGVRADVPLTVIGRAQDGVIRDGTPFIISTDASLQQMKDSAAMGASVARWTGIIGLGLGPLMILLGIIAIVKR